MNIFKSINDELSSAAKTCKTGAEAYKSYGKIAEQEKIIKKMTNEMGKLVLIDLDNGVELSPAIMERYAAIKEARATIESLNKETADDNKACPLCRKKATKGMLYCGNCGWKLDEPVVKEEDGEAESADAGTEGETADNQEDSCC